MPTIKGPITMGKDHENDERLVKSLPFKQTKQVKGDE